MKLSLLAAALLIGAAATVAVAVDSTPNQGGKSCCSLSSPPVSADEAAKSCHPAAKAAEAAMSCHAKVETSVTGMSCHTGAKVANPDVNNQPPPAPSCH